MKRFVLFSISLILLLSLAAPTGAAFASGDITQDERSSELAIIEAPLSDEDKKEVQVTEAQPMAPEPASDDSLIEPAAEQLAVQLPVVPVLAPQSPEEEPLPPQRKVFATAFQVTNALGFVELYNSDTRTQAINGWRFVAEFADELPSCEVPLLGYILPKTKVLLAREGMPTVNNALFFDCGEPGRILKRLTFYDGDQIIERLAPPQADQQVWTRKNATATYLTGIFSQDFKVGDTYAVTDGYWYKPPLTPSVQVLEVYVNPRTCVTPDQSVTCYDYIKLKNNSSSHPVDLSDYRIRTGYSNAAALASNTIYSSVILAPGEVRTLTHDRQGEPIGITANDGALWFEDAEGVVSYPLDVSPYVGSDLAANKGRSWAFNNATGQWQWATPSPETEENNFTALEAGKGSVVQPRELVPCGENQYRSEETNRCRTIATPNVLTPCKEGQYRSEETNRCRSIATAVAAVLKPCNDGEFRNPETNRCKKIASSEDVALADCGEGRERNPLTNRCRNVIAAGTLADTLPFPVEKTPENVRRFAGWWILGTVMLLGASYGMWEWRYELLDARRKAVQFIRGSK